jgi:hypothetical protein
MATKAKAVIRPPLFLAVFLAAGLIIISTQVFAEAPADEIRLSITTQNTKERRDHGVPGVVSEDEFGALVLEAPHNIDKTSDVRSKTTTMVAQAANEDFWFYSADVVLFNDHDRDGYFHGIDLLFDADTYYTVADVYAVVYLSYEGGPWNEYAATDNFTIFGTSSDDDYVIVTELLGGYPSGSYDILIELFDAWDDSFVAWFGPEDTSELAFLPLEDADRDVADVPDVIIINKHGGGSLAWLSLLTLALVALARRRAARCA